LTRGSPSQLSRISRNGGRIKPVQDKSTSRSKFYLNPLHGHFENAKKLR